MLVHIFPHWKRKRKETKKKYITQADNNLINAWEVYWALILSVATHSNIPLSGLVLWRDCSLGDTRNPKIFFHVHEMSLFWCYNSTGFMKHELSQKGKQSAMPIILIASENTFTQTSAQGFPQWGKSCVFCYYTNDHNWLLLMPVAYLVLNNSTSPANITYILYSDTLLHFSAVAWWSVVTHQQSKK